MKNIILCLILIPTFAMLYASCRLGNTALGMAGVAGIAIVTLGAFVNEPKKKQ